MAVYAAGKDNVGQLGVDSTTKSHGINCVDSITQVPIDIEGIQCISSGDEHSIIIKQGRVFAAGNDTGFQIGSDDHDCYRNFTEIKICNESILWAACSEKFTIYLTNSGKVILCHMYSYLDRIFIPLDRKAISVFSSYNYGGIIDEEGSIYTIDMNNYKNKPTKFSLGEPAVDLVLCYNFTCALTSSGRVYGNRKLNSDSPDFAEVPSLKSIKIEKLSGYYGTCAALSFDGRVFMCGFNSFGQFGNGTTIDNFSFTEIRLNEEIKDVSCSNHTLFLTKSNIIIGCGFNEYCQLFKKTEEYKLLKPLFITSMDADQVISCGNHSFILSGTGKILNPAKKLFIKQKMHENHNRNKLKQTSAPKTVKYRDLMKVSHEKPEKIDKPVDIFESQSQNISQLMELCQNISQQNESNKVEIRKIQEEQKREKEKFEIFRAEIRNNLNDMNQKLDRIIQYINDQDIY